MHSPSPYENPALRVHKTTVGGRAAWVKRAGKDYRNGFQRLFSGGHSLQHEVARIRELQALGVAVPDLLEVHADHIVLSDIGLPLENDVRHSAGAEQIAWAVTGAEALAKLHRAGGWHGNAALRNLMRMETGQIGFIDFETSLRLPLVLRQSLDLWHYAHSASRFNGSGKATQAAFAAYEVAQPKLLLRIVCLPLLPLAWLLTPFARFMGRDVGQAIVTLRALF